MATSADKRERESNFADKWENTYKPSLTSIFISKMNKEMKKLRLRGTTEQGNKYTLKVALKKIDDNGNTLAELYDSRNCYGKSCSNYADEIKGGHFGDYIGLLKQGFEAAGEIYGELLADRID